MVDDLEGIGESAKAPVLTAYQVMVYYAAKGKLDKVRLYASYLQEEFQGHNTSAPYEVRKGYICLQEGQYVAIDQQQLEHFLSLTIAEAERIKPLMEKIEDPILRKMWQDFFESLGFDVPEYDREKVDTCRFDSILDDDYHEALNNAYRGIHNELYYGFAKELIERNQVDWLNAWKEFEWADVFHTYDQDIGGQIDNSRALDLLHIAQAQCQLEISQAIMKQYFLEIFEQCVSVQSASTWVGDLGPRTGYGASRESS